MNAALSSRKVLVGVLLVLAAVLLVFPGDAPWINDDATLIAGDGVHGSPAGYARRAQAIAGAVRACAE